MRSGKRNGPVLNTAFAQAVAVTGPGATTTIADFGTPAKGYYRLVLTTLYTGTLAAAERNNMRIVANGAVIGFVLNPDTVNIPIVTTLERIFCNGINTLTVQSIGAGTGTAIYYAGGTLTRISISG